MFSELGENFVTYGIERRVIRIVATGSSYEFARELAVQSPLISTRRSSLFLQDPAPDVVQRALERNGYTQTEAAGLVMWFGTRLRLLQHPLSRGAAAVPFEEFVSRMRNEAGADLSDFFEAVEKDEVKLQLVKVLDAVLAADQGTGPRPLLVDLSKPVRRIPACSRVLFWDNGKLLYFQSVLIKHVWKQDRSRYTVP